MKVYVTEHGFKRIAQRKIASEELKTALMYGSCACNDNTTQKYEYADLKIITGLENQIITVWRYNMHKDTRSGSRKKHLGRKARIHHRQRLTAMQKAEHYKEMRSAYNTIL